MVIAEMVCDECGKRFWSGGLLTGVICPSCKSAKVRTVTLGGAVQESADDDASWATNQAELEEVEGRQGLGRHLRVSREFRAYHPCPRCDMPRRTYSEAMEDTLCLYCRVVKLSADVEEGEVMAVSVDGGKFSLDVLKVEEKAIDFPQAYWRCMNCGTETPIMDGPFCSGCDKNGRVPTTWKCDKCGKDTPSLDEPLCSDCDRKPTDSSASDAVPNLLGELLLINSTLRSIDDRLVSIEERVITLEERE